MLLNQIISPPNNNTKTPEIFLMKLKENSSIKALSEAGPDSGHSMNDRKLPYSTLWMKWRENSFPCQGSMVVGFNTIHSVVFRMIHFLEVKITIWEVHTFREMALGQGLVYNNHKTRMMSGMNKLREIRSSNDIDKSDTFSKILLIGFKIINNKIKVMLTQDICKILIRLNMLKDSQFNQ
jgi:hypothetical protein